MTTIRSSKLSRYMVCAGYMHLEVEETEAGDPAKEGTACGEVLQYRLENKPIPSVASNGWTINSDMLFYTQDIHDRIKARTAEPVLCETRIDWQTRSGIWIRGQYDAAYVDKQGRLCVDDLKYGWGLVEVKNNWQLLAYAIGECIRRGQGFNDIVLRIMQPRPHHEDGDEREWVLPYKELLKYKEEIEVRMEALANGLKTFQTSSQCKYCSGAAEACPAFSKLFYKSLEITHDFLQDSLNEDEISKQLDLVKRAEEVIAIKRDSLMELGNSRIKKGKIIPGYVQVEKYSHRNWKNGVTMDTVKLMTGKDVSESSMMSPAKAEKLGISKNLVKHLSESRLTGLKLEKKDSSAVGNKIFGTNNPLGG